MKTFYQLLLNSFLAGLTSMSVWFSLSLWVYVTTGSVLATSIMSGIYLVATTATSIWFGSLVDHHKKKNIMMVSSIITLVAFCIAFALYQLVPVSTYASHSSPYLWALVLIVFTGMIVGNIRNIAMPTLVTLLVAEKKRDKANGMVGTVSGVTFLLSSIISGFLLASSGMFWIFLLSISLILFCIVHLYFLEIPEKTIAHVEHSEEHAALASTNKFDFRETLRVIRKIPGLLPLIIFTSFNNFLGGVFMPLLDPYGLSLVSLQVWGILWGFLSLGFIFGGGFIAKFGLGKNPLRTMFLVNVALWIICIFFTIQPWIILLCVGIFLYICFIPFIEASEHTIIQKIVPRERQGRVFGFAQSIETAASPITAFAIGPIAQFVFIPFMTTGAGVDLIGGWFGTGPGRGIALVFMTAGMIGLLVTILAMRSKSYAVLSKQYLK
jgi:DHA3 family multidrug efflux protein-like MFS transporter